MRRLALAFLLGTLALFTASPPVLAHASLVRAEPAPGSALTQAPQRVTLWFSEPIEPRFSQIRVLDSAGVQVDKGDVVVYLDDPKAMSVSLNPLTQGIYTVAWRNLSTLDGHALRDSFTFAVGQVPGLGPPVQARPPWLQSPLEPLLRWLSLLGGLTLLGGSGFFLLVASPALGGQEEAASRLARRGRSLQWAAAGALAVSEVAKLLVQASTLYEIPLYQTPGPPALGVLEGTEWGRLWLWRIALLGATAAAMTVSASGIRGKAGKRTGQWLALATGAGLLATFSLASHGSALSDLRLAGTITDYLHLLAASFWVGGLAHFLLGMPVFQALSRRERQRLLSVLVPRFSTVAGLSAGVLIITGLYSAWAMAGTLVAAYTQTGYGLSLLAKIALVAPLAGLGAWNFFWVRPRLSQGRAGDWLRKLLLWEVVLAVLALLAVGFLTALEPARLVAVREGLGSQEAQFFHVAVGDKHINVRIKPGSLGPNRFLISVDDLRGDPISNADVGLRLVYAGADLGATDMSAASLGGGEYSVQDVPLGIAGSWQLELTVRSRGSFDASTTIPFKIAAIARVDSGVAPASTGNLLFAVELLLLGFLFQGAGVVLGGWKNSGGAALMALGAVAAIVGIVLLANHTFVNQQRVTANPLPADERSLSIGKQLYIQYCRDCHGAAGAGDGPLSGSLKPRPLDLSVHVPLHPEIGLYRFIDRGVAGTSMAAWGDTLTPEEIWHVINYLKTFVPVEQ